MLPVVVAPDAEYAALTYLRPLLAARLEDVAKAAKVQTLVSSHRPLVHLRRIGGSDETPGADLARIDAMVYGPDDMARMQLARIVHALFFAAASDRAGDAVITYQESLLGPRHMPDPADDTKRVCLLTVDLLVRPALPPRPPAFASYSSGAYDSGVYGDQTA